MARNPKPQPIDPNALDCITTGTGYFKAGVPCRIVAGGDRVVYLGPVGHSEKATIAEFTLEFQAGNRREFCQYGRDFVFAASQQ